MEEEKAAIDWWWRAIIGQDTEAALVAQLRTEVPPFLSWIVRGGCAVQCEHCIFPTEGPKAFSTKLTGDTMLSLLTQLEQPATLIHEGRQLLPWQVPVLRDAGRAGYSVSLINNGQYATPSMLQLCEREGLQIDALDVSVDGPERIHNTQRASNKAWQWAMKGMAHARELLKPSGMLTSLMTLTAQNFAHVGETGETVVPMVDAWHLTTMSLRSGLKHMRAEKRELAIALEQLFGRQWEKPVYLRTYSLADAVDLLELFGPETARRALLESTVAYNAIVLDIEGIPFFIYPKSLQINETLVVDADNWWRLPFCIAHTLLELQAGRSAAGEDLSHFSIEPVSEELDITTRFSVAATDWWRAVGKGCFESECEALRKFL
jgi:hypothetical protein